MAAPACKITVLGSGTSVGVPTIGCHCNVCTSSDPRDQRLRPSVLVSFEGRNVLIDTTPDLRTQALRAKISHLDAVLFTHSHADHVMGLDDVRPFNYRQKGPLPIYASEPTMAAIVRCFPYIFDDEKKESNVPRLERHLIDGASFELFGMEFRPVPILHGSQQIYGFRFASAAYLTDHSAIPESSMTMLEGLDVLFLDALRYKPHPTHSTVDCSIKTAERLAAKRTFFTHICHDLGHERAESLLPAGIHLAFDGLELEVAA
jgi:phosphoribosyl 1,2-cyclic phosphate phosphodiesterase